MDGLANPAVPELPEQVPDLVFGVRGDEALARRHLAPGTPVFDREVLVLGVVRGRLGLGAPLFMTAGAASATAAAGAKRGRRQG